MAAANSIIGTFTANVLNLGLGIASIVLPASPGVAWNIQNISIRLISTSGVQQVNASVLDGVTTIWQAALADTTPNPDEIDAAVNLIGTPGNSMTIAFAGFNASTYEQITVTGTVI